MEKLRKRERKGNVKITSTSPVWEDRDQTGAQYFAMELQYLEKQLVKCIMITLSYQPTLHITVAQSKTTFTLSAQPV